MIYVRAQLYFYIYENGVDDGDTYAASFVMIEKEILEVNRKRFVARGDKRRKQVIQIGQDKSFFM